MKRRATVLGLTALGLWGGWLACAAQPKPKTWRIGVVWAGPGGKPSANEQAFLEGLKAHGYEPGRNLIIDARHAGGNPARYPALVGEVLALNPDLLVGTNTGVALEMKRRTATIPIVLGTPGDPVGSGLARSLARPGGNVTGMSLQIHELSAKHVELLAELLPKLRQVAVLSDLSNDRSLVEKYERIARSAGEAKRLSVTPHRVGDGKELRDVFADMAAQRPDALIINPSPRFNVLRREIIERATGARLATVGFSDEWAQEGALAGFGPSFPEAFRRAADYVDRILKGAKPGDLPIEQPTKFTLSINRTAARRLEVRIPDSVRVRADRLFD